jgi:protein-tyrosine phosphatase
VPLLGASNVRDLGGWPADGGRVRFGCVFRGAALSALTQADAAILAGLGVRTVCDLRGVAECAAAPTLLPGAMVRSLPIEPSITGWLQEIAATREATDADVHTLMRRAYTAYALEWGHRYRAMFDILLEEPGAVLLHCSAGKDRTGFGAALILTALGVPRQAVMQDYLASNLLWRRDAGLAAGLPPQIAAQFLLVRAELLEAALAAIDQAHGGFERYAEAQLGLDAGKRQRLRDKLIGRDASV